MLCRAIPTVILQTVVHAIMAQSSNSDDSDGSVREIRLTENPDGQWTARDLKMKISAQGATREEALDALDEVVAALRGEAGHEPTNEELHRLGVDPDVARNQDDELPDVLQ